MKRAAQQKMILYPSRRYFGLIYINLSHQLILAFVVIAQRLNKKFNSDAGLILKRKLLRFFYAAKILFFGITIGYYWDERK